MNDYVIRNIRKEDAKGLLEFLNQAGKESDNLSFGEGELTLTVEQEEEMLSSIENNDDFIFLVAYKDGKLVGNTCVNRGTRRFRHRASFSIVVLQEEYGKGLSKLLMEEVIKRSKEKGIEIINLEVRSDNIRAIKLYEKYCFKKCGTSPKFFKINNQYYDADLMCLELN